MGRCSTRMAPNTMGLRPLGRDGLSGHRTGVGPSVAGPRRSLLSRHTGGTLASGLGDFRNTDRSYTLYYTLAVRSNNRQNAETQQSDERIRQAAALGRKENDAGFTCGGRAVRGWCGWAAGSKLQRPRFCGGRAAWGSGRRQGFGAVAPGFGKPLSSEAIWLVNSFAV